MLVARFVLRTAILLPLLLIAWPAQAQRVIPPPRDRNAAPLATRQLIREALNPDGTLKQNLHGSFDARGWRLRADASGQPRFEPLSVEAEAGIQTVPSDRNWDPRWSSPGTDQPEVYTVAVRGSEVFIGGSFLTVSHASVKNIARWDGLRWRSLGINENNGVNGTVYSIAFSGEDVYVGGSFSQAGKVRAHNIARWRGGLWHPLGAGESNGLQGTFGVLVYALATVGQELYAGGHFSKAGGLPVSNLARWDMTSQTWSDAGGGVSMPDPEDPAFIAAIAVRGNQVYVGGKFKLAGTLAANYVAMWNRADGVWSPLSTGTDDWVLALAVDGATVYASGFFRHAGGNKTNHIARWNGRAWSALGDGLLQNGGEVSARVRGLAVINHRLYAAGDFNSAGGVRANSIARWDGRWLPLDEGLTGGFEEGFRYNASVLGIAGNESGLYAVGAFNQAGDERAFHVAKWDAAAQSWAAVADAGAHNGVNEGNLSAIAISGEDIYVAGDKMWIGGILANGIARWNGRRWSTLGSGVHDGVNGFINSIAIRGDDLYVGGYFSFAGDTPANRIARWDGMNWSALGSGIGDSVDDIVFSLTLDDKGNLYAGGFFDVAGDVPANSIARWDGVSWSTLGKGELNGIYQGYVFALEASGNNLYVGGSFSLAGGSGANNIAKWDGNRWSAFIVPMPGGEGEYNGVNGPVFAVAHKGRDVYVGGSFDFAGGSAVNNIAKWNGSKWSGLGSGLTGSPSEGLPYVLGLKFDDDSLIATGYFMEAGGTAAHNIAVWDGGGWSAMGSGLSSTAGGTAIRGDDIFVVGDFSRAGGKPSVQIARWHNPQ